jgi:hypothetical protein
MRVFALAFAAWLVYGPLGAAEQASAGNSQPPASRLSPFSEFVAQPHALKNASSVSATKPAFEQTVRTPQSRFLDIRRHAPGALYECVIPEVLRDSEQLGFRPQK